MIHQKHDVPCSRKHEQRVFLGLAEGGGESFEVCYAIPFEDAVTGWKCCDTVKGDCESEDVEERCPRGNTPHTLTEDSAGNIWVMGLIEVRRCGKTDESQIDHPGTQKIGSSRRPIRMM